MSGRDEISDMLSAVEQAPRRGHRLIVAVAGPPASGKSMLAEELARHLCARGHVARVVPMDGWHLSNQVLKSRGLLDRKGAPDTFDLAGFSDLVRRIGGEDEVFFPIFDRDMDVAVVGGGVLETATDIVIVEGNYLLLGARGWVDLRQYWDLSIALRTPVEILRDRLVARWLHHGLDRHTAILRAESNDIPNAIHVIEESLPPDIEFLSDFSVPDGSKER